MFAALGFIVGVILALPLIALAELKLTQRSRAQGTVGMIDTDSHYDFDDRMDNADWWKHGRPAA